MTWAQLICEYCGRLFPRQASQAYSAFHNPNTKIFCSRECARKGRSPPQQKLNRTQVNQIRAIHARGGTTLAELAREYQVSIPTIHFIVKKKTWL